MITRTHLSRLAGMSSAALLLSAVLAPAALAHTEQHVGDFQVLVGWLNEPALVGQPNAVQLTVTDHDDHAVTDLGPDDVSVVLTTAGQDSDAMPMIAAFDVEEGWGTPGEYHAEVIPTAPGDYSFHFTGKIHDTPVDLSVASGPETFDGIAGTSDLEFPVKQPSLSEVATRLDRIDGRIVELQGGAVDPDQLAHLETLINDARGAADQASRTGLLVGGTGLFVAVVALWLAWGAGRRSAGTA